MSWIIFWVVVGLYWVVAIKRTAIYYHRCDEYNRVNLPYSYKENGMRKEAAWGAIGLASIWPFYEAGRWFQNYVIHSATAEQRKQAEYEKAEQIVADYKKNQEKVARETFEREMRGGSK